MNEHNRTFPLAFKRIIKKESILLANATRILWQVVWSYITYIYYWLRDARRPLKVTVTNWWKNSNFPQLLLTTAIPDRRIVWGRFACPDIELFSVFGSKRKVVDSKATLKIFMTGECTSQTSFKSSLAVYADNCLPNVNLAMGFDYFTEPNYLRFPIWMLKFPLHFTQQQIQDKLMKFHNPHHKRPHFCSLIASHDRAGLRLKAYNALSQIGGVTCPGSFLNNTTTRVTNLQKTEFLSNYQFDICLENSVSSGYVTEKIFDALLAGTIPIYHGYHSSPEPAIINPNALLFFNEKQPERILEKVRFLHANPDAYAAFRAQNKPFSLQAAKHIYELNQQVIRRVQELIGQKIPL